LPKDVEVNQHLETLLRTSPFPDRHETGPAVSVQGSFPVFTRIKEKFCGPIFEPPIYHFGIRLSPNGTWIDAGLAEKLIAVLERCQIRSFLNFDLLLSAFLLHDRQAAVVRHLFKLNLTDDESAKPFLGLVWHHCEMCQIESPLIASLLANLHPDDRVKCLTNVQFDGEFTTKSERVYMAIRKYLFSSPIQVDAEYVKLISAEDPQDRHRKNERDWQQLWRRLSIDPAPWSVNLESEPRFTRDFFLCAYGCPFKVKRNWRLEHRCSSSSTALSEGHKLIEVIDDRILSFPCNILKILKSKPATFLLFDEWIELKIRDEPSDVSTSRRSDKQIEAKDGKVIKIRLSNIVNILFRRVSGKPSSIEIFTILGRAFLIQFVSHNALTILKRLASNSFNVILQNVSPASQTFVAFVLCLLAQRP
jgi:hypothetical protein